MKTVNQQIAKEVLSMERIIENWKMTIFPSTTFTPTQKVGNVKYVSNSEKLIFDIIWDNDFVLKERSTLLVTSAKNPSSFITIYLSNAYIKLLLEKEYALAGIWHEIGHIHHEHLNLDITQEEISRGRYQAIENNQVYFQEREADAFATKIVGKNRMIQFLQFCKNNRLKYNDANSGLAIKEFDLRINQIKRI